MPQTAEAAAATAQMRRELTLVSQVVGRRADLLLRNVDPSDVSTWFDRSVAALRRLVLVGFRATAASGVRYVTTHAEAEGVRLEVVEAAPNVDAIDSSLEVTIPVAFKTQMAISGDETAATRVMRTRGGGSIQRLVLAGARETTLATLDDNDVVIGYRRVTAANPCDFCAMLAARGAVYRTSSNALTVVGSGGKARGARQVGQSYHDGCRCTIEPIYG